MAKIVNLYYTSSDVSGLASFYRQALELTDKFADADRWVQFDVNGVNFAVSSEGESAVASGGGAVATFQVADLEARLERVVAGGGEQAGPIRDMGSRGRTVPCKDPAGNVFQLIQR